ncbi:MAG TPA: hypothetical protein VFF22_17245 [Pseudomonas sp.]|nr:MAG: hypothetical protein A2W44_07065 [Acinetobacter sp. RIFCSPHIGHO2_12_41_5]HZX18600.1 hypothetical protein [Pseudomonas sp.]
MPWTIENALNDDAIERTEETPTGYSFWLKGIPTEIRVVLAVNPTNCGFNFYLSHYIHTPTQAGKYCPSRPWGDYEAYALHLAVTAITQHYKEAITAGHKPNENWLIANQNSI